LINFLNHDVNLEIRRLQPVICRENGKLVSILDLALITFLAWCLNPKLGLRLEGEGQL